MASRYGGTKCAVLMLIFLFSCMVKYPAFTQPDGISRTLLQEDACTGNENLFISSLFAFKNSRGLALRWKKRSVILTLLLLFGDVEIQPGPLSLSREQFQQLLFSKGLKIVHQNIRRIVSNFDMLQELVVAHPKIDIITLSETHLTKATMDINCKLDGYTFIHRNRDQGEYGGVAMYVKNNITFTRRIDLEEPLWRLC